MFIKISKYCKEFITKNIILARAQKRETRLLLLTPRIILFRTLGDDYIIQGQQTF